MMQNSEISRILQSKLNLRRPPVAVKIWAEEPRHVPRYQDTAFPGFCTQVAEVLETGSTFYTVPGQCFCTGGFVATGVAPPLPEAKRIEAIEAHLAISKGYETVEAAVKYERAMEELFPPVQKPAAALQLGLLASIETPELVLLFCTPKAADILTRTFVFTAAEPIRGFSGNGACPFLLNYPHMTGKPTFSYSDVAWRKYAALSDDELTVSFPYAQLLSCIGNLPEIYNAYMHYGEPAE